MDSLSATLSALSDPTRRALLARLQRGPATVTELAQPFRVTQQAISKHLACLERARLIDKRRDGRQQVCSLEPGPLRDVAAWVDAHRRHWTAAFARLEQVLDEPVAPTTRRKKRR